MGRRTKSKQTKGFSSTLGARQQWPTFTCQPSSQVSAPTAVDWLYATGRPKANQYQISDTGIIGSLRIFSTISPAEGAGTREECWLAYPAPGILPQRYSWHLGTYCPPVRLGAALEPSPQPDACWLSQKGQKTGHRTREKQMPPHNKLLGWQLLCERNKISTPNCLYHLTTYNVVLQRNEGITRLCPSKWSSPSIMPTTPFLTFTPTRKQTVVLRWLGCQTPVQAGSRTRKQLRELFCSPTILVK